MTEKTLPLDWIKTACEAIYGRAIADRTWRGWKRICEIDGYQREASATQAAHLCTLAKLKRDRPNIQIGLFQIRMEMTRLERPVEAIASQVYDCFYTKATGRDLPTIIRQVTGRTVSTRTLYRWAEKHNLRFRLSEKIPRQQIQKWIDLSSLSAT